MVEADQDCRRAHEVNEHQSYRCNAARNDIVAFGHLNLPVTPSVKNGAPRGATCGWIKGALRFNRSLLADPRKPEMKDILNRRVKHRQAFRPFAPIVLAERAREVFEGDEDSPFMLIAKRVRPEWRDRIPAIVHVDGTARVQTVREATNPMLHRLLREFEALTGVPVLVNTSFNVKGEPIVETPRDAVVCFLTTGIDHLMLHDQLISKNALHRIVGPLVGVYTDVATMVMSSTRPA